MEASSKPASSEPHQAIGDAAGPVDDVCFGSPPDETSCDERLGERSTQADVELDYDGLPYEGACFDHTHPGRLAVMARLFGLSAPAIETARVLELGCASGENLIPMSAQLPHATFLGTDLSGRQIRAGQRLIADLGLRNIRLEHVDILELSEADGVFDYIICHGVYSWVPGEVRAKILDLIRTNLAPDGVACISYNVYPGWHQRHAAREIMLYAADAHTDPRERIRAARTALDFVEAAGFEPSSPYGQSLRATNAIASKSRDAYLYHDYMERNNQPFWFHEFWDSLVANQLAYVTDTHIGSGLPPDTRDELKRTLEALASDRVRYEQYVDFLRNRMFRQSVIVRGERVPTQEPRLDQLETLAVSGELVLAQGAESDIGTIATMVFLNSRQQEIRTTDPMVKAVLWELGDVFPAVIRMETLRGRAAYRVPKSVGALFAPGTPPLGQLILRLVASGSAELHVVPPPAATDLTERPEASAIARHFATIGGDVPNQRHRQVTLSDLEREALVLFDGSRTLPEVSEGLLARIKDGELTISSQGTPLDHETLRPIIPALVDRMVQRFLRQSLLVDGPTVRGEAELC